MLHVVVTSVCVISGFHGILGLISVIVGIISSIKAEVWLAHSVSPIWSGSFFIITGILGIFCARRKTSYVIMCFTAFSVVSMVVSVVSIQLLRLGLVNHTTDGHTFQKQNKDTLIIIALALAGSEIIVCLLSTLLSCRMAKVAKEELCKRREGMFHVKNDADENDNDVIFSATDFEETNEFGRENIELQVFDDDCVASNSNGQNILAAKPSCEDEKSTQAHDSKKSFSYTKTERQIQIFSVLQDVAVKNNDPRPET